MIMDLVQCRSFTLTAGYAKQSRLQRLKKSVPQELVFAPLLYNVYSNDPFLASKKYAYADDVALLHTSNN